MPRSWAVLHPYVVVAGRLNQQLTDAGLLSAAPRAEAEAATVQGWISRGRLHLLAGNLESGWTGDSRTPLEVRIRVPHALLNGSHRLVDDRGGEVVGRDAGDVVEFEVLVDPQGMVLLRSPG